MKQQFCFHGIILLSLFAAATAQAVTPQPDEFHFRSQWMGPLFGEKQEVTGPYLKLLYEERAEAMSRGRSWRGTPYKLGDKTYTNGLGFNSTKHLLVVLGKPAERFIADVGLENNDDTQRGAAAGHGSVTFHILVNGNEVFTSPVLRLKDEAYPVDVPLKGAAEGEIRVKDAGDGRSWDAAPWADAVVKPRDGTGVRLQDLPLA